MACQIIENFYGIKFAICETNYGTHLCKTCRKLFDRYDAIVKSLEHLKHKLYNDAQKFATVRVVKRQTKSPLALPLASNSTTPSGRQAKSKRHHYAPSPSAIGTAPNATAKPCNLADTSGSDVERTTAEPNSTDTLTVSDHAHGPWC